MSSCCPAPPTACCARVRSQVRQGSDSSALACALARCPHYMCGKTAHFPRPGTPCADSLSYRSGAQGQLTRLLQQREAGGQDVCGAQLRHSRATAAGPCQLPPSFPSPSLHLPFSHPPDSGLPDISLTNFPLPHCTAPRPSLLAHSLRSAPSGGLASPLNHDCKGLGPLDTSLLLPAGSAASCPVRTFHANCYMKTGFMQPPGCKPLMLITLP